MLEKLAEDAEYEKYMLESTRNWASKVDNAEQMKVDNRAK
jgi:hypothetical protein